MFNSEEHKFPKFENKVRLSSPTMYPDSMRYVMEAYETNWMSTVGENINEIENDICRKVGRKYAAALSVGIAALHIATKLAGEKIYGKFEIGKGALFNRYVVANDMTFDATVNESIFVPAGLRIKSGMVYGCKDFSGCNWFFALEECERKSKDIKKTIEMQTPLPIQESPITLAM